MRRRMLHSLPAPGSAPAGRRLVAVVCRATVVRCRRLVPRRRSHSWCRLAPAGGALVLLPAQGRQLLVNRGVQSALPLVACPQRQERPLLVPLAQLLVVAFLKIAQPVIEVHVAQRLLGETLALGLVPRITRRASGRRAVQSEQRVEHDQQAREPE